jgi:hypothetical protein
MISALSEDGLTTGTLQLFAGFSPGVQNVTVQISGSP